MDNTRHRLDTTWAKAFDEIYCHHASLFIPYRPESLFDIPDIIMIGVTVRYNNVKKRKIISTSCSDFQNFLPCHNANGGLIVPINSAKLIDALSINSWTSLKGGKRGTQKEFPTRIFYVIGDKDPVSLPFETDATPYLAAENKFSNIVDDKTVDTSIIFDF